MAAKDFSQDEFVTVFSSSNYDAESEAEAIQGLLESAEIEAIIVRDNVTELPTGKVEVRVLEHDAEEAIGLIKEASSDIDEEEEDDDDLFDDDDEEDDDEEEEDADDDLFGDDDIDDEDEEEL